MQAQRPSERRLIGTLVLVIGSFLASTLLSQIAASKLHADTRAILDDALPSIAHLSALRTGLFREQLLLERVARSGVSGPADTRAAATAARADVERELEAYERVPPLVGERPLTASLRSEIDDASRAFDEALEGGGSAAAGGLLAKAEAAFDRADTAAHVLLDLEAMRGADFTRAIGAAHADTVLVSLVLDAMSALLTVVLAAMTWRAVRYYMEQQEAQRRRVAERASELDSFAGRVAHDIVNPLSSASLALALIRRGQSVAELAPRAEASLKRVSAIVDALLALARSAGMQAAPGGRCDPADVLRGVVADASERARARGITVTLEASPGMAVACEAGALASVAGNLLDNAIKYVGASPGVKQVAVRAGVRASAVRVEVEDNGPGIAEDLQPFIFQPFVRGHDRTEPGMGLGLATAKRVCEAHGGGIGVRSEAGRGATFWFELPHADPARRRLESRS